MQTFGQIRKMMIKQAEGSDLYLAWNGLSKTSQSHLHHAYEFNVIFVVASVRAGQQPNVINHRRGGEWLISLFVLASLYFVADRLSVGVDNRILRIYAKLMYL